MRCEHCGEKIELDGLMRFWFHRDQCAELTNEQIMAGEQGIFCEGTKQAAQPEA